MRYFYLCDYKGAAAGLSSDSNYCTNIILIRLGHRRLITGTDRNAFYAQVRMYIDLCLLL